MREGIKCISNPRRFFGVHVFVSLTAKGTLISEPRFSTPCEMQFLPTEKGKTAFKEKPSTKAISPFSRGKNRISWGVENRGSPVCLWPSGIEFEFTYQEHFSRMCARICYKIGGFQSQKFRKGVGGQRGLASRNPSYATD